MPTHSDWNSANVDLLDCFAAARHLSMPLAEMHRSIKYDRTFPQHREDAHGRHLWRQSDLDEWFDGQRNFCQK